MSVVTFRCPYCGQEERHAAGQSLPEMCGVCFFERGDIQLAPEAAVNAVLPDLSLPIAGGSSAARVRRKSRGSVLERVFYRASLVALAAVIVWKVWPIAERFARDPAGGILKAMQPSPLQSAVTEYLAKSRDNSHFVYIDGESVRGEFVRKAWQTELNDMVFRWEEVLKKRPGAKFEGVPADSLHERMAQIREFCEHINQLDKLTYFRMRYRTRNAAGVDEPRDKLFVIDGDKVTHAIDMKADFPTTDLLTSADARIYFVQLAISKGGSLRSKEEAIAAIRENPRAEWRSRY